MVLMRTERYFFIFLLYADEKMNFVNRFCERDNISNLNTFMYEHIYVYIYEKCDKFLKRTNFH